MSTGSIVHVCPSSPGRPAPAVRAAHDLDALRVGPALTDGTKRIPGVASAGSTVAQSGAEAKLSKRTRINRYNTPA